ncbi:biotin synthase auxiliary protein BsaP [Arthrobacter alkaliphilus]|uniref:biotin synthase auxiliary protein BsaP n=1 Tax=Arthrobacter alkaliphilus TaxID=369936 RepID=UPI003FD87104
MNGTRNTGGPAGSTAGPFCGHCGGAFDGAGLRAPESHRHCHGQLALEPPRYCAQCRRRMKVQVTPLGWTAQCSRHGVLVP